MASECAERPRLAVERSSGRCRSTPSVELYGLCAHRVLDAQRRGARGGHRWREANGDRAIPASLAAGPAIGRLREVAWGRAAPGVMLVMLSVLL